MFCPPPDPEELQNVNKTHPHRRRKKKFASNKKHFKNHPNKKSKFAATMSSWAENFAIAATWQLKHQVAHWKARAKALEYENKILHDIILKNHYGIPLEQPHKSDSEDVQDTPDEQDTDMNDEHGNGDEFEVSEEFVEFLRANVKYKEDARLERERLKAKYNDDYTVDLEAAPTQPEDMQAKLKELYGSHWQRIAALEMSVQTNFMSESDKGTPMYWPNIPFNFNFS